MNTMNTTSIEVSVVMPCLNEEGTLGICIEKAQETLNSLRIRGEVVIADNGSTDNSVLIAQQYGARVVHEQQRGYGAAYLAGLNAAHGKYIIMGDSDDTYDFTDLNRFITPLKEGYDMVMGNRFKGKILRGAMPWMNQHIGNPILSGMLRLLFRTHIGDSHCGMRSFTATAYKQMDLKTIGMEFASEMVIKAVERQLKIQEIPITYHPRGGTSKLNAFRDAARHIHFMLKYKVASLRQKS